MRIIVVGNGLAGTIFSKTVRDIDSKTEIDIFAREKYLYYPRPNLIEYMAENLPYERLFAFPQKWYDSHRINLHLGQPVQNIAAESNEVELNGDVKEKYDALLLANGAHSFLPPIKGADKKGVFTLRTLDDALAILDFIATRKKVTIVGGGLLGLEIARALKSRGADVEIVEFFPRLLPRQLDPQGAEILKNQIEAMGIKVRLGVATEELAGEGEVKGLRFKGGGELETEAVIVAAGVRPNIHLAAEAGLRVDRGIFVNEYLQTSRKNIFAAGDNVQFQDRVYGIIPAAFEQARTAASNVFELTHTYGGTVPSNTLKVVGLDLTSIGLVNPEQEKVEELRKEIREEGIYKKIVIQGGKIVGAIWMGTRKGVKEINQIISQKMDVEKWKDSLLDENFDFSVL